jgi:hypothetical protein
LFGAGGTARVLVAGHGKTEYKLPTRGFLGFNEKV